MRGAVAIIGALAVLAAAGCGGEAATAVGADAELTVSAAASLRDILPDAAEEFEREHAGARVRLHFAASGVLLQQVRRGAPVDLLLSASPAELDRLHEEGRLVPGSRRAFASNRLVVVVPAGSPAPRSLQDLHRDSFARIAVANPRTAPLGRHARQALEAEGLWQALRPRLVFAESARQTLEYVVRGETDAGLLYRTDASIGGARLDVSFELAEASHGPIVYEGAVIEGASRPKLAADFLTFLATGGGRPRLAARGFLAAPDR